MNRYQQDIRKGRDSEHWFKKMMEVRYGFKLRKSKDKYCFYDFSSKSKKVLIELKSRNNARLTYATTILGEDKVRSANRFNAVRKEKDKYTIVFAFEFTDGVYYIIHEENRDYQVKQFKRNHRSGAHDFLKDYVFIPVDELRPISILESDLAVINAKRAGTYITRSE